MTLGNALQILELSEPFTRAQLKKAYTQALKVWHPDRFATGDELHSRAHEKTRLIIEAFGHLSRVLGTADSYPSTHTSPKPPPLPRADDPAPSSTATGQHEHSRSGDHDSKPDAEASARSATPPSAARPGRQALNWTAGCLGLASFGTLAIVVFAAAWVVGFGSKLEPSAPSNSAPSGVPPSSVHQAIRELSNGDTKSVEVYYPKTAPVLRASMTFPGGWIAREVIQSDVLLKYADPTVSHFVIVRAVPISDAPQLHLPNWIEMMRRLPDGAEVSRELCREFAPPPRQVVSARKRTVQGMPALDIVWEITATLAGKETFMVKRILNVPCGSYIVAVESAIGGAPAGQIRESARQANKEIQPLYDRMFSTVAVSTVRSNSTPAPPPPKSTPWQPPAKDLVVSELRPTPAASTITGRRDTKPPPLASTPLPNSLPEWTSSDGVTIRAKFIALEGQNVLVMRVDGVFFKIPLSRLSQKSQAQARSFDR